MRQDWEYEQDSLLHHDSWPRPKLEFLEFSFVRLYVDDQDNRNRMNKLVREGMIELFNGYKRLYGASGTTSSNSSLTMDRDGKKVRNDMWSDYKNRKSESVGEQVKTKLEKYLAKETKMWETVRHLTFCVGGHINLVLVHSYTCKDCIFVVHVSTVASESAFIICGRVIDSYKMKHFYVCKIGSRMPTDHSI